jgi:hypothetical protein
MACEDENGNIDLQQSLNDSNARIMALDTNILDQVGGKIEFGRREDLFWIVMTVILAGVIIVTTFFRKKRKR